MTFYISAIDINNKAKVGQLFFDNWGSDRLVTRGRIHQFDKLDGFIAISGEKIIGVLTYKKDIDTIEVTSLDSFEKNKGIGTALLDRLVDYATTNSIKRLWLITTNDNLNALKFYQKRKWKMIKIHKDAVIKARKIKPSIPMKGNDNIEIRHEIELEYEFVPKNNSKRN